jgi:hypothetical protein
MKKKYMRPYMRVSDILPVTILSSSPIEVDPNTTGDQSGAEGRRYYGVWEDEDDDYYEE